MTADEARKMTADAIVAESAKADSVTAKMVLAKWHEAIRVAARAGHSIVRESDLKLWEFLESAKSAARARLVIDGFEVTIIRCECGDQAEVSW